MVDVSSFLNPLFSALTALFTSMFSAMEAIVTPMTYILVPITVASLFIRSVFTSTFSSTSESRTTSPFY